MAHLQLELRIALIGKTGVGKSACGNTILGRRAFVSTLSSSSVTAKCKKETGAVDGQTVAVVDTPGLYDTKMEMDEVKREVAKSVCFASPGPHVFLIMLTPGRFTEEEEETVKILQKMFGEEARKYSMVLFTHGDALEADGVTIETLVSGNQHLRDFVSQCGGGHHVFNNRDKNDRVQVTELLKKINTMVQRNGGSCFTNGMFREAERDIRKEQRRLLKKNPAMAPEEARKQAERDNSFNRDAAVYGGVGAVAGAGVVVGGAATAAKLGATVGSAAGPVGALVGAGVGALVGVAAALKKNNVCSIQ